MVLLGNLIARSLKLRKKFRLPVASPITYQKHTLRQLLERGQYTAFGKKYGFWRYPEQGNRLCQGV